MSGHLPEVQKEAEEALAQSRAKFMAWAVQEGGPDLQFMNINSTVQIQQLLFAPSGCSYGGSRAVTNKQGRPCLEREKQFAVENTTNYIEPGKKKPLKNRMITIRGLGIPAVK